MNPSQFITLICSLLCFFAPFAHADDVAADEAWPGVEFTTVRAYLYREDPMAAREFVIDGNLNNSVQSVATLNAEQIKMAAASVVKIPDGPASQNPRRRGI